MKKISKFSLFSILILITVLLFSLGVSAQNPKEYEPSDGIQSAYYTVNAEKGWITGIAPGTSSQKLLNTCVPAGVVASSEKVATGTTLSAIYDTAEGPATATLTAIITGDLNGDAAITITDMLRVKSAILGEELSEIAAAAGDINSDGKVTITDFLRVKSHLLGLEEIGVTSTVNGDLILMTPNSSQSPFTDGSAVSYRIQNPKIASVDEKGIVTAAAEGSTYIYGLDDRGAVISRKFITVLDEPVTVSLGKDSCVISMGQTQSLKATFNHPVSPEISWSSSNTEIVTVENGVLTGKNYGSATVTAEIPNGSKAEISVTVAPPITDMEMEKSLYKVKPGNSRDLGLVLTPSDTEEEIQWSSSNTSVATVNENGTVTGVTYGTVTITATGKYSGLSASCKVKVCNVKQVAMTFDDGPSDQTTRLLNFLKENDIQVTFFLVGNRINSYSSIVKRQAAEGHEIGYHSYAHANQPSMSSEQITSDFRKTNSILKNLTGKEFTVWRTPGGDYNSRVLSAVPVPHIMWSVDTLDWKNRNSYSVYSAIVNRARDGSIILMHDLYGTTVDGATQAMKEMLAGDYEFVTVTELLSRDGTPPRPSTNYFNG